MKDAASPGSPAALAFISEARHLVGDGPSRFPRSRRLRAMHGVQTSRTSQRAQMSKLAIRFVRIVANVSFPRHSSPKLVVRRLPTGVVHCVHGKTSPVGPICTVRRPAARKERASNSELHAAVVSPVAPPYFAP